MTAFIKIPFAGSGDKTPIPDTDPSGGVNMTQGYPVAYSKDPAIDPSAKRIERELFNGLMNRITAAINEIQVNGVAPFITTADNGGTPFAYGKGAIVIYNNITWMNMVANNATTPSVANSWLALGGPMIGIPFPWQNTALPDFPGAIFMKCNASNFNAAAYPLYAAINPSLKTPELRGEFIRGWDDGRGVDAGRALLSAQLDALQNITGAFSSADNNTQVGTLGALTGVFAGDQSINRVPVWTGTAVTVGSRYAAATFDASRVARTATETRPQNIAFNYIVRVG